VVLRRGADVRVTVDCVAKLCRGVDREFIPCKRAAVITADQTMDKS
jgi:hypothetical protein